MDLLIKQERSPLNRVFRWLGNSPKGWLEIGDSFVIPTLRAWLSDILKQEGAVDIYCDVFLNGRAAVVNSLKLKWPREEDYRLRKTLWAFTGNRIAVRFE